MDRPSERVRAELARVFERDQSTVGEVYRLTRRGMAPPQIADAMGRSTSGYVSNNRAVVKAVLEAHTPGGRSYCRQTASSLRRVMAGQDLSSDAQDHLDGVLAALASAAGEASRPRAARAVRAAGSLGPSQTKNANLRTAVDDELRARTSRVIAQIRDLFDHDPDDYQRVVSAASALDEVAILVIREPAGRTLKLLAAQRRLDLSLEAAVLEWAAELPLRSDVTSAARARLDYYGSDM